MDVLIEKNKKLILKCEILADKNEILQNENDKLKGNIKKLREQLHNANKFNNKIMEENEILTTVVDSLK